MTSSFILQLKWARRFGRGFASSCSRWSSYSFRRVTAQKQKKHISIPTDLATIDQSLRWTVNMYANYVNTLSHAFHGELVVPLVVNVRRPHRELRYEKHRCWVLVFTFKIERKLYEMGARQFHRLHGTANGSLLPLDRGWSCGLRLNLELCFFSIFIRGCTLCEITASSAFSVDSRR